jgi:hypothetical protein
MAGSIVATTSSRKGRGIVRIDCALTCASGAISAAVIGNVYGRLVGVMSDPTYGAGATMTSTADILLTDGATGAPILSDLSFGASAFTYRPTQAVVDSAGAAITPATTANDLNRDIFVAGTLKLAIANATTTDTGLLSFIFDEG